MSATSNDLLPGDEPFRLLVESVREYALFVMTAEGRVATWNIGAERLKGYRADEIIGRDYSTFFTPEDRAAGLPAQILRNAIERGSFTVEGVRLRKDGTRFWAEATVTRLNDAEGRLRGFAKVTRDQSERHAAELDLRQALDRARRAEEELRQHANSLEQRIAERTERLELANAELQSFSYSVSHDLRAPLRSIEGFASALDEDYGAGLDATAKDYLRRIRAATGRMGGLIDDMLKLARVTRAELDRQPIELARTARDAFDALAKAEPDRRVELTIDGDCRALADATLARIVLDNLLSNAWKFSRDVAQARVAFAAEDRDRERVFSVRDNGVGFDPQYATRLFVAFQRLHDGSYPGSGIGLATVARVVQRHGGRVWAESTPGAGAAFFFTLGPSAGPGDAPSDAAR
ncbi:MAG: PAS domain S-box protein [Planctomycetes bacterium]|nr:PAS domain S-box protein [Planctomycetota bacterium]